MNADVAPAAARIRVYLITYRRPTLLKRALDSLRAQTWTDWVCELHNDDPRDTGPGELLRQIADARITLYQHERNLGPINSFNLAYAGSKEPFFTLLEDDNWWEPEFLHCLLTVLEANPAIDLVWSNMRIWQESQSGWTNTGRTIWPIDSRPHVSMAWPQLLQFDTPLHSNGAMLARSSGASSGRLQVETITPFDVVENVRERLFSYPLVIVTKPLANYALTLSTARPSHRRSWVETQALLSAAFLRNVDLTYEEQTALWAARRMTQPRSTSGLFWAALLQPTKGFLHHAQARDWVAFFLGCIRSPVIALAVLSAKLRKPQLWGMFVRETAAACRRQQLPADIPPKCLLSRVELAHNAPPSV
jgi:hypothetical protein